MNPRTLAPAVLAVLALAAAGCGGDDDDSDSASTQGASTTAEAPAPTEQPETAPAAEKPKVAKGKGSPPKELRVTDIREGTGAAAKDGDTLTVHYVGVLYKTGKQFDASWDRGQPFPFPLGGGQVIPGWDRGLVGMKVGGRRRLEIPPDLAYGESGTPDGSIPPNSALIFVVDLVSIG